MKTKLNVRLLRRIQKQILAEPRRFDMEVYFNPNDSRSPCGSVACIAGWACVLDVATRKRMKITKKTFPAIVAPLALKEHKNYMPTFRANRVAAKLIGISKCRVDDLFTQDGWPEPFSSRMYNASTPRQKAKIAVARIEHLIKTGE